MTTTAQDKFFAEDLTVTLDEQGTGRPILLLHGGGGAQTVSGLAAGLSEDFNVFTPIHPGFSLTPRPDWYDGIDDIALTYLELLERRDLHDVLVIGSSLGGWIAAEMAVREHQRITGTVLIDAVGIEVQGVELADFFALTPKELAERSFHDPALFPDPAELPPEAQEAMRANAAALTVYAKDPYMHDPKLRRRLALVTRPVLAIWGESDGIAPVPYGRAYAESFPDGRFELVAQAGHLPHIEQPQLVLGHIRQFAGQTRLTA
jgi:pimeloyl-ACP methyl ester carboxylesterase